MKKIDLGSWFQYTCFFEDKEKLRFFIKCQVCAACSVPYFELKAETISVRKT